MKFKTLLAFGLLSVLLLSALAVKPTVATAKVQPQVVDSVTINLSSTDNSSNVLATRFLNMLNHNFVYGEDFYSVDEIVNLSIIANLAHADESGEFIKADTVYSYVYDMYGIEVAEYSQQENLPQKDGHLFILPQGYTTYKHSNARFTLNEDGTYTVTTSVTVSGHDSEAQILTASTLFVKNPNSIFGFNIVSSNFVVDSLSI